MGFPSTKNLTLNGAFEIGNLPKITVKIQYPLLYLYGDNLTSTSSDSKAIRDPFESKSSAEKT
jgi:hypothetical protein